VKDDSAQGVDQPPVLLSFGLPDGSTHTVEVTGPGGTIRVAVGSPARRSSIWVIKSPKRKSDVYVTASALGGAQKFSLHAANDQHPADDWRYAWVSQDLAEDWTGNRERLMDRWDRPEASPEGWTKGLTIRVPHGHLSIMPPDEPQDDSVIYLPEPEVGRITAIYVALATPDLGGVHMQALPVDAYRLVNGEVVVVLWWQEKIHPDQVEEINGLGNSARLRLQADQVERLAAEVSTGTVRAGVFGHQEDGTRFVWDLRLESGDPTEPAPDTAPGA
jgi:hypothetical protein